MVKSPTFSGSQEDWSGKATFYQVEKFIDPVKGVWNTVCHEEMKLTRNECKASMLTNMSAEYMVEESRNGDMPQYRSELDDDDGANYACEEIVF